MTATSWCAQANTLPIELLGFGTPLAPLSGLAVTMSNDRQTNVPTAVRPWHVRVYCAITARSSTHSAESVGLWPTAFISGASIPG